MLKRDAQIDQAIRDQLQSIADLAKCPIVAKEIEIKVFNAPHKPPSSLPKGKMAVYVFFLHNKCLKVGKVGPKSSARYTSQHYNPESSRSNLAKSILKKPAEVGVGSLDAATVGKWIKNNTDRIDILFPEHWGPSFLNLAEAFLQCWLKPVYEGFESQKAVDLLRRREQLIRDVNKGIEQLERGEGVPFDIERIKASVREE